VVTDPAVAPTCTKEGKTAGSHCSVCGAVIQAQETVAKIDHTWDNGRVTADATCYDTGVKTYTCTQCKTTKTEAIPTISHTVVTDPAVAPTCTKEGKTAGSHCSVCGGVIQSQETVAKIDHTWDNGQVTAAATCYDTGVKTYTCTMCKTTKTESIPTISHTVVTDPAVAPTCTKEGKTAGSHCSVCGAVVQSQETVAKIDHTWDNGRVTADATTTAAGVTTYTCTACGTTRTEEIPKLTVSFADVPEGQYFTQPVAWAVSNGITNGTGANTFSPEQTCSRGQIVTFLWRAAGKPIVDVENPFTDVKEGAYYYDAVLWAYTSGITTGTGANTFSPDANCTRGQIVTFLWRYAGSPTVSAGSAFQDVAQGQYYTSAVYWAVANGITNGTSQTTFSPNTVCTRSQAVTFLYRYAG
jgi:predicted nucleic acid-binding Zn ribbon protein